MLELFKRCLSAAYTHTAEGGDYALSVEGNILYLLFEWSDGAEDWKNNFDFPAKPYKRMKDIWFCHRGFLRVWKAMRDEIEDKVSELLISHPSIAKIKCIGYSHGSPLSALATEDMAYLYGDKIIVEGYGFGAPRVFWGFLPKDVKQRLNKFVSIRNKLDIVTHVPPMVFGYRNSGKLIKIGKLFEHNPIKAHYPEVYIKSLEEMEGIDE